jgi:hypothetical protein
MERLLRTEPFLARSGKLSLGSLSDRRLRWRLRLRLIKLYAALRCEQKIQWGLREVQCILRKGHPGSHHYRQELDREDGTVESSGIEWQEFRHIHQRDPKDPAAGGVVAQEAGNNAS